ncbi:MAG: histidine phosphatase family protein [Demequina sp.]|nr:histidine phosphatase family protein [Demequina sp.]
MAKGKLAHGETLPQCAIREVAEETGKQIVLGQPLPTLRYPVGAGRQKVVRYWAAQVASPEGRAVQARPPVKIAPKHEVDRVRWLTVEQAMTKITFPDDLRPLEVLAEAHANDRLETRAFVLVRHARARRRKAWDGEEDERPLTKAGQRRARQLVPLIAAFGVTHVSSSPATRCMETIAPYAKAAKLPIKTYPALTEPGHGGAAAHRRGDDQPVEQGRQQGRVRAPPHVADGGGDDAGSYQAIYAGSAAAQEPVPARGRRDRGACGRHGVGAAGRGGGDAPAARAPVERYLKRRRAGCT